jgi:uncharacterized phiE125 gp8 family phage protein
LPRNPVQSVSSFTYVDTAGTVQTLPGSGRYQVSNTEESGRITPVFGQIWPVVRWQLDAFTVQFVAGYGDTGAAVPETLKHAIRFLVAHWYDNREPVLTAGSPSSIPHGFDSILWLEHSGRVFG